MGMRLIPDGSPVDISAPLDDSTEYAVHVEGIGYLTGSEYKPSCFSHTEPSVWASADEAARNADSVRTQYVRMGVPQYADRVTVRSRVITHTIISDFGDDDA